MREPQIGEFRFSRPPVSEQGAIADLLGALDDKIELNRRMNETLEELASTVVLGEAASTLSLGEIAENIRDKPGWLASCIRMSNISTCRRASHPVSPASSSAR